jgi:asparagine synthase (glutamine-hydrolysing)
MAARRGVHVVRSSSRDVPQQPGMQQQVQQQQRSMCGLVAAIQDVWSTKNQQSTNTTIHHIPILADPAVMERTASILNHRGPDGMHTSRGVIGYGNGGGSNNSSMNGNNSNTAHWSMGHTRLAIVDPSNRFADMPFNLTFREENCQLDKTIHLAANGEIYNHQALYSKAVSDGWTQDRTSGSDCEVIAHCFAKYGGPETARMLDGMFAFVVFEHDAITGKLTAFAARDPVGIKPLYYGRTTNAANNSSSSSSSSDDAESYVFASELKALVGHVDPTTVVAIPPGHYWTPTGGLVCYYNPEWLRNDDYAPWEHAGEEGDEMVDLDDRIRAAFTKAVQKRMMSDVDYGFFLSGGVDSCIVAHDLLPLYRAERAAAFGDDRPIPTFTVGMENSPDVMAAKGMVEALGGSKYVDHQIRYFTPDDVFDLIPKIIYHMETYEAELIRSAIPNWLLAERASQDVRMVLTGEGADVRTPHVSFSRHALVVYLYILFISHSVSFLLKTCRSSLLDTCTFKMPRVLASCRMNYDASMACLVMPICIEPIA